jgi:Contractile injection system tube protein
VSLKNLFKLEKLTIEAFENVERSTKVKPPDDVIVVMFNPTTFGEKHTNSYDPAALPINASGVPAKYAYGAPSSLKFDLVLDGTGVEGFGVQLLGAKSVRRRIADFKKLCLEMNGTTHEPNFLKIRWGNFKFSCRLAALDITYELFDEAGDPLRAKLGVTFVKDESAESIFLKEGKNSPDLTHVRVVKSGDTLPLLCKEIYGSSAHYLRVAADNGLDDFRNLVPGQTLHFAPLK